MKNILNIKCTILVLIIISISTSCSNKHVGSKELGQYASEFSSESGFETLKPHLEDKRIVLVGEAGHYDNAIFELKGKLFEYLIDSLDFEAIALEGLNPAAASFAEKRIINGNNAKKQIEGTWSYIFSKSDGYKSFVNYLGSKIQNQEVDYVGFDIYYTDDSLIDVFKNTCALNDKYQLGVEDYSLNTQQLLKMYMRFCKADFGDVKIEEASQFINQLNKLNKAFERKLESCDTDVYNELQPYVMLTKNLSIQYQNCIPNQLGWELDNYLIAMRDQAMFQNICAYLEKKPEKRIIVSLANFHSAKDLSKVSYVQDSLFYRHMKTTAEWLVETYRDKVYSLALSRASSEPDLLGDDYQRNTGVSEADLFFFPYNEIIKNMEKDSIQFESSTLGSLKTGYWLNVFDGLLILE